MDDDVYPMSNPRRGQFVLINNKHFKPRHEDRLGTDVDASKLEKVFGEILGFKVTRRDDLTAHRMLSLLIEAIADEESSAEPCDCFVVAVLSHGTDQGCVYGTDKEVNIDNLLQPIQDCKQLVNTPKLFIFQACRGSKMDDGMSKDSSGDVQPCPVITAELTDCLYAYSSPPGHMAWRNTDGSWFIQALCDQLAQHAFDMDIVRILTRVNRHVAAVRESYCPSKIDFHQKKQCPSIVSKLTKELQFTPKKCNETGAN